VPEDVYRSGHEVVDARMADEETLLVRLAKIPEDTAPSSERQEKGQRRSA